MADSKSYIIKEYEVCSEKEAGLEGCLQCLVGGLYLRCFWEGKRQAN